MYQEVPSNLTTIRQDGQLKESEDEGYSSLRNIDYFRYKENNTGNTLYFNSSEDEDIPPVLTRYSEVSIDDLEFCCSSPPDLSIPCVSVMKSDDLDVFFADAETVGEKIISSNGVGLREVNKDGLDSYSFKECDKIDGKMFHSFETMEDLEAFTTGRRSNHGEKFLNQLSTPIAEFTGIKTTSKRELEKGQPFSEKNIPVFAIDENDVDETSTSQSDPEKVMITEDYQDVKSGEQAENASTNLDPGIVILERELIPDKLEASFLIIPEETYVEDYDVPSSLKRDEFQSVVECGYRFCILGCVCSSLYLLKPRSQRCIHLECMFDDACTIKSKLTYSPATENEDEGPQQCLSSKKEIQFENILKKFENRLLDQENEIEKLKIQLTDQQAASVERKTIKVAKTDEFMVNGKRVQDGLYMDSFPFKKPMLDRLAKNTTVSLFIRQLMREMFTAEYLSSKTLKLMNEEHVSAIIEAAKERFSVYRGRNGSESNLTEEKIKVVMMSVYNMAKAKRPKQRGLAVPNPA